MQPRFNIITLGVADLQRAIDFYEKGLGWQRAAASQEEIIFFKLNSIVLALYPKHLLEEDATIPAEGTGFSGITIAYNARTEQEVDETIALVESLGATIVKRPQKVFWGGYSSYYRDLDGYLFEVAYHPFFQFDETDGLIV